MNLNESNIIDDYLMGNLSAADRMAFEKKMAADPELQNQVSVQKDIIKGLEQVRTQQLKARLNKIPVSSSAWYQTTSGKVALGVSLLVAMLLGALLFNMGDNENITSSDPVVINDQIVGDPKESNELTTKEEEKTDITTDEVETETPQLAEGNEKERKEEIIQKPVIKPEADKSESLITEKAENEISETEDQSIVESENTASEITEAPSETSSYNPYRLIEIETTKGSRFGFHYRFYENKLSLYGDFGGERPYEILEINNDNIRGLFLYYEGQFFELDTTQNAVPLKPLDNTEVVQDLMEIKNQK
ncbi:hypothetical protein [Mangrovivirga cuniculi]|uniref:Zinc-finger domain-containing protein n=1 Tax=Mangrovivirga cuniculi TaxID=2715131 RepID=A0A4D7JIQ0_9BACT|nr:hypothetical protein [Mangrovivirga cuniculi]QCK15869.1 hypothetical protein DCC35_14500 [Mangrovivirga cuniculi]